MTARVLVVDDLEPNVKLLEAKLRAEYFDVLGAYSGPEALKIAENEQPDIILLDVMMPGMDGFEVCKALKSRPETMHIPVIMITALEQQADRLAGLNAGADDFLTKPVEDIALFARVRSLTRLKMMTDELRMRHATGEGMGLVTPVEVMENDARCDRILILDEHTEQIQRLYEALGSDYQLSRETDPAKGLEKVREGGFDLIVVNMSIESTDPLRLCSTIRSFEETRLTPILAVVREGDTRKLIRSLDIGVNDYVTRPVDREELQARVATQLRRKHHLDQLRSSFQAALKWRSLTS